MGTKVPKEKSVIAVCVRQRYIDGLTGPWQDTSSEIWKFIKTTKLHEQAASLKKIGLQIKESENIEPVLDVLVDTYLQCPPKHQIKRALASCLESVSSVQPCVETVMKNHIGRCLRIPGPETPLPDCRTAIDNCNSLMENFALGERCLQSLLNEALTYLSECLKLFHQQTQIVSTPVALTEAMHNCHVTVQVWNKLVARADWFEEGRSVPDDLMADYLVVVWAILLDDNFLVDCRAACGMTLPLVLKVTCRDTVVEKVVRDLFPTSEAAKLAAVGEKDSPHVTSYPTLGDPLVSAQPTTMVCVAGGCLGMLGTGPLGDEVRPGESLLVDVIGRQLIGLIDKMHEVNSKVLLSRTLVLWTSKTVQVLTECSDQALTRLGQSLHGEAPVPAALLEYAWTHWEDATDVIRHQARLIFDNLLKCHLLATNEEPSSSPFLLKLMESLLSTGWQHRGRYGPLCCLVGHLGTSVILQKTPRLPRHLLAAIGDQTLAGYISELYEKLFSEHRLELGSGAGDPAPTIASWLSTWVDPLLEVLCEGSRLQKTHVIEYILPKLLKHSPDSLPYMTHQLTDGDKVGSKIGALVTCLKRAKMIGLLQQPETTDTANNQVWYDVVSVDILKKALCHQNEQVRLDAFGLLCENLKTTETLSSVDIELVVYFLPLNTSSQSPAFRQHLAALLKKLFVRLRDGAQALRRKIKSKNPQAEKDLQRYREFVKWFLNQQFKSLYLGASFPCRTMALGSLRTYTSIMVEGGTANHRDDVEFALSNYITPEQVQTLLECLTDSFEQNKADSFSVLTSLPHQKLYLQSDERLESLFQAGLSLASSTRPQDCTTAAYLLRVLLREPALRWVALKALGLPPPGEEEGEGQWGCYLLVLEILVGQLRSQLEVARRSLVHAAATQPLYPTLHCIRYLLEDVKLRSVSKSAGWRGLIKDVIDISFNVAQVVSPVVSNSSPEGNVPLGPGLALDAVVKTPEDEEALHGAADSARTISLIPEYLVVCCWRSIKECSLLLGQLTMTAPLTDPHTDPSTDHQSTVGLLSVKQLHEIGDYFTTQLLESRHRGAFELAYAGFVKMTEMLWKCPLAEVQALPRQWLTEILEDIKARDPNNTRLCATRRSAGVPFYVQAIVSAEPVTTGRTCFKQLMTELLALAEPEGADLTKEDPAQVHALNVLRALYRDTRLGDDVFPYVAGGLRAAILGYGSQLWPIRNSATLLFSALMTRIFGVKRSKDEMSKKNCLTGRVFFHRFPSLYQFLLDQIAAGTSNIGSSGVYQLHPGLYPVLMVLARLYPSVVEGSNTTLNTAAFVPHVIQCASSPVYKTRIMAARAIRPLVGKDQITATLTSLLECLPKSSEGATSQNKLHGVLLQITELVESVSELPVAQGTALFSTLTQSLEECLWILTDKNPCLVTRKAFTELCFSVLTLSDSLTSLPDPEVGVVILKDTQEQLTSCSPPAPHIPELTEFYQILARRLLTHISSKNPLGGVTSSSPGGATSSTSSSPPGGSSEGLLPLVVKILQSEIYEVRLEGLEFLGNVFVDEADEESKYELGSSGNEIKSFNVAAIKESESVYRQLISLAMSEQHTECLTKALELVCNHTMIHSMPWRNNSGDAYQPSTIMERMVEYKTYSSDDLRCAAHELSACLIPHLYKEAAEGSTDALDVLSEWCKELERRCATEESVSSRLTTASSLLQNGQWLLVDPKDVIGPVLYDVWTVVVRLLQDEDVDVRHAAARVVHSVTATGADKGTDEECAPQPMVALQIAVSRVVALRAGRDWRGLFDCLLGWILTDIEPEWPLQEEKEVRLFDKGEMNTYRDEMVFVTMVAKSFKTFLQSSLPVYNHPKKEGVLSQSSSSSDIQGLIMDGDMFSKPNVQAVVATLRSSLVRDKLKELLMELRSKVDQLKCITGSTPLLMTSEYQEDMIVLCRLKIAISCLLPVVDEHEEEKEQMSKILSEINQKFKQREAQANVLSTLIC